MSADTIPADVQVLAKIETFEKDYAGSIYIGGAHLNRHLWPLLQEIRSTLEAERARADAAARLIVDLTLNTEGDKQAATEAIERAREAEHWREAAEQRAADALARVKELEFGAGFEAAFDAVVRPGSKYENWTPADDPAEIVTDLYNDLEDALARAEKAEGSLETARGLAERGAHLARTVSQTRFRLEDGGRYSLSMFDASCIVALAGSAVRAAREAQPATDGGDNG